MVSYSILTTVSKSVNYVQSCFGHLLKGKPSLLVYGLLQPETKVSLDGGSPPTFSLYWDNDFVNVYKLNHEQFPSLPVKIISLENLMLETTNCAMKTVA